MPRGRPINLAERKTTVVLDPELKRRALIRGLQDGHQGLSRVITAALRAYLRTPRASQPKGGR